MTDWKGAEIARLAGADDAVEQERWVRSAVSNGLDVLGSDGAAILWAPGPIGDMAEAMRHRNGPFFLAMDRLLMERPDVRRSETVSNRVEDLVDAVRLRSDSTDGGPRVLVVGDSTARTVGYGLERWAQSSEKAVVWSAGTEGCGIANEGATRDDSNRTVQVADRCRRVPEMWQEQIDAFRPDVIVVLSTGFDLQPRRLDNWTDFLAPGDPVFDQYLLEEYEAAADVLSSGGAVIQWMTNPCLREFIRVNVPLASDEDVIHVNRSVLADLERRHASVDLFDLHAIVCPGGAYAPGTEEVPLLRPDGIHFSPEGAQWLAREYGDTLVGLR